MTNYLNGCGYGCLFRAPSEKEKATTKYQRKNSAGLAILWTTVSEELQGILLENDELFLTAWNALGDACGKNSTVTICRALTRLTSLMYEPGSSLDSHIDLFLKLYASYKSLVGSSSTKMELSKEMAAAFFLQSLDRDRDLSSLVQTLYDVQPFDVTTITKRVALEQSRRHNVATEALFTNNRTPTNQGNSKKPSGNNTSNSPTAQGEGDNKKRQHHKKKRRERTGNHTESVSKRLEKLEKLLLNNSLTTSANAVTTRPSLDQSPEKEHCSSDSDAYYLSPEKIFATDYQDRQTLYLDTGCGRSVVNNLALLSNVISVKKNIRTFGSPVEITHQGTMNLYGYHIAPVSFAPKGPVNLISVSQLVDHGIRPHYKNDNFLIKQGNSIVAAFTRDGNLYSNRNQPQVNLADAIEGRDWHVLMGHPSDKYLESLLTKLCISEPFTSSKHCEVCSKAKIQRKPHKSTLPQTSSPFFKIHSDTLEISPVTRKGYRYVLVLIDDYTRFNRIYPLNSKDQSENMIISYFTEIKNKLNITPAYFHSDRGGEFTSARLKRYFLQSGTSIEQGAPNSPQTNGVAERFNKTLLSKIRCLLCQSNIPITYWDEAARHASRLLNHTPHRFLNFRTPLSMLKEHSMWIEPELDYFKLIPFGHKVHVLKLTNTSKVADKTTTLRALTHEQYSDAMRFLDIESGKIIISRDFIVPSSIGPSKAHKQMETLPNEVGGQQYCSIQLPLPKSPNSSDRNTDNLTVTSSEVDPEPVTRTQRSQVKGWDYVPHYDTAPQNISSNIDEQNILQNSRQSTRRSNQALLTDVVPYSKAVGDTQEKEKWQNAMNAEFSSLMQHNTGHLVPYPKDGSKVIGGMWRLTKKRNEFGEVYRYKARWVVLGNHQIHMLHYFDTWSSVGRNETFKILLSMVVNFNFIAYQFDVETAFLHGDMDTVVYVKQVKGFEAPGKENWVWLLNRSLYGTKQAPRMWKVKFTKTLNELNMFSAQFDDSLFINKEKTLFLHLHVDDGFLISQQDAEIKTFLNQLTKVFTLKMKRYPTQHLGYKIDWLKNGSLFLSQEPFARKILQQFDMNDCRPVKTPCNGNFAVIINEESKSFDKTMYQRAIGYLNYLSQHTRPDLVYTVNQLARFSTKPNVNHWNALKHVFRYIKGTADWGIHYQSRIKADESKPVLEGWADSDYANCSVDRKSISGNIVMVFGNPISWLSKRQTIIAQSTTEAEFVSMNICSKQLRWLSMLMVNDMNIKMTKPVLYNDNSGSITISKQATLNPQTKHIEVRYQYLRQLVLNNTLEVRQVSTNDMIADVLTKPLSITKLDELLPQMNLVNQEGVLKKNQKC
ncbi:hypothetical protein O181_019259 [Austropuccinia psidii MF-1]|uniref:Integrase catalytic domain-containing protein n=1 Tax=Austropuccinia psidii MF-1 TaxID=1389203 RepID=A0A9Q3GUJ8_9BASI|nr:hypothetical protein [Austropuccinia psidii MF-1]